MSEIETEGGNDRSAEFAAIVDVVRDLAETELRPTGFGRVSATGSEISLKDFESNQWLDRVLQIQEWCRFDDPVSGSSPEEIARGLFLELGASKDELPACFTMDGDRVIVGDDGLARLQSRIEAAQNLKDQFLARAEDVGVKAATKDWHSEWDERVLESAEPISISASVGVWPIYKFADYAKQGELDLNPSYQRDVVWSNSDSQKLIESILRGIPLPSIILNQRVEEEGFEIVDGKQRITAILRFIGGHPDGRQYAEELEVEWAADHNEAPKTLEEAEFFSNYKRFRRRHRLKVVNENEHFLPFMFKVAKATKEDPLTLLSGKYYCDIKDNKVIVQGRKMTVEKLFTQLIEEYKLPVIVYTDTDVRQIQRVFGLYNKQGKHLNEQELRNAIYHHLDFSRLMLVTAGENEDVRALIPFVDPSLDDALRDIGPYLKDLGYGHKRYRRVKTVSWIAALLFNTDVYRKGKLSTPSTATHINELFKQIENESDHPLCRPQLLAHLAEDLLGAKMLHETLGALDAWSAGFKSRAADGSWQEIATVASLVACLCMHVAGIDQNAVEDLDEAIRRQTSEVEPPDKQQHRSQWGFISKAVLGILDGADLDRQDFERRFGDRYDSQSFLSILDAIKSLASDE